MAGVDDILKLVTLQYPTLDPVSLQRTLTQVKALLENRAFYEAIEANSEAGPAANAAPVFPKIYQTPVLLSPILVTEGNSPVDVTTLNVTNAQVGKYRIVHQVIPQFDEANDRLRIRVLGTWPSSSDFMTESKEAGQRVPFQFETTQDIVSGQDFTIIIQCSTDGPGAADVWVDASSIFMQRIA